MKTRFKIYLTVLAVVILLGAVLHSIITDEVPPTSPFTAEDLQQLRQTLTLTNRS